MSPSSSAPAPSQATPMPQPRSRATNEQMRVGRERTTNDPARAAMFATMQSTLATPRTLQRGHTGGDVEQMQQSLVDAGFMTAAQMATGPGIFGPQTEASVRALQTQAGLPATGVVDADTRRALARISRAELRRGAEGPAVLSFQRELVANGFMTQAQLATGPGIFGPKTEAAVRAVQQQAGLPVTGVVDAATRSALRPSGTGATAPPAPTPPAAEGGPITDVATGNEHFVTQYFDPTWNPSGPSFSANCGPASVAMALSAAGEMPGGLSPEQEVDYARALMNPGHGGITTIDVNGTSVPQLDRDSDYSNQGQVQTAFRSSGGSGTWGEGWSSLDSALANGPVVVDGYYSKGGWGSVVEAAGARQGTPGRAGTGETGHLLSVLGMTPNGQYLVADPMFTGGVVTMSRDELAVFCGDPSFVSFR